MTKAERLGSSGRLIYLNIVISQAKNVDDLLTALIQCDVVVYDVSTSEAEVEDCLLACNGL